MQTTYVRLSMPANHRLSNSPCLRAALLGLALVVLSGGPLFAFRPPSIPQLPNVDKRVSVASDGSDRSDRLEATARIKARNRHARVEVDDSRGGASWVWSSGRFLTGPHGRGGGLPNRSALQGRDDHRETVKAFLDEYRGLFGHGSEALNAVRTRRDYTTQHNGLRSMIWEQQVDGIPVFGATLSAHITRYGQLVNIESRFIPDAEKAADLGTPNRSAVRGNPPISARDAVLRAASDIGEHLTPSDLSETIEAAADGAFPRHFMAKALTGETRAGLVWLPMDRNRLRLCWQIILTSRSRAEMFREILDAQSGEILLRHNLTFYAIPEPVPQNVVPAGVKPACPELVERAVGGTVLRQAQHRRVVLSTTLSPEPATYRVFTSDSPSPFSPGWQTPNTAQPPFVSRSLITMRSLDPEASPQGWIPDGVNETRGNNVDAHLDLDADDVPDIPRPQGTPYRVFDFPLDLSDSPSAYRDAAVTHLFYWCNWMHDRLYQLGFNEASGNFQEDNFGRGGYGGDAVIADAQDSIVNNNASFLAPPDGIPGQMQVSIFDAPEPDRDGDLDAEIILHEYTHGLSNRLVGGGTGISELQSAGLGEGWSDFYAMALLSEAADNPSACYANGGYITYLLTDKNGHALTENYYYGIRRYPYSTDMNRNPLTFRDIDPEQASEHTGVPRTPLVNDSPASEVHNQGEVWCSMLWDARARLIGRLGYAEGSRLILQLITDGMRLSPANPSFLQARDAILQADLVDAGGANQQDLWEAFARRGLGVSASSSPSSTICAVHEAFDTPSCGTIYVNKAASGAVHDGISWATAYLGVQQALDSALPGQEVWVASGTYTENITLGIGVRLYGGFSGAETSLVQRDPSRNVTVLDGGGSACVVLILPESSSSTVIDGFTIRNGTGYMRDLGRYGGGIYCAGSSAVISNNTITGNRADFGAGIVCDGASPVISGNIIVGNAASVNGGGIYCAAVDVSASSSDPTIHANTISGNEADLGGGIYVESSIALITGNTIAANSASVGAGVYLGSGSSWTQLMNNLLCKNSATSDGGGVYCYETGPRLINNTISGNTSGIHGGGICYQGVTEDSRIANNIVVFNSSGIHCSEDSRSPELAANCVYGNTKGNYSGLDAGASDVSLDPLFLNRCGDYRLSQGSPCIDAGVEPESPHVDRDESIRPTDGDGDGGHGCDIGAYEYPLDLLKAKKSYPDGSPVVFGGVSVTAVFSSQASIYVQRLDRSAGIRVDTVGTFTEGQMLNIVGTAETDPVTGERYVRTSAPSPYTIGAGPALKPLGITIRDLGARGLDSTGLLVRIWGTVKHLGSTLVIEDGSGERLRLLLPAGITPGLADGDFIEVTGVSLYGSLNSIPRALRIRRAADIRQP